MSAKNIFLITLIAVVFATLLFSQTAERNFLEQSSLGIKVASEITKIAQSKSQGKCAAYVREAVQRAKGQTVGAVGIVAACDYGKWLQSQGFSVVSASPSSAITGDISVFVCTSAHQYGHIQVKCSDGKWRSDFVQNNFYPYADGSQPSYTIYRPN